MNAVALNPANILKATAFLRTATVTVRVHDGTVLAGGALDPAGWSDLSGHANIGAQVAPAGGTDTLREIESQTEAWTAILDAYYPLITASHRVLWNANLYRIVGHPVHDSQQVYTRLNLERVSA